MDRGDFSPCGTPTGLNGGDPFDLQAGKLINYEAQTLSTTQTC